MSSEKNSPRFVIISDVHYSVKNLELSDAAVKAAITKATELKVHLIIAGDLHDTKALMNGAVVNRMLNTFSEADCQVIVLTGNHDRLNEASPEHALNFLRPFVELIDQVTYDLGLWFIPYNHDVGELTKSLSKIPHGSILIMHQGVFGAESGEYTHDKSAIDVELLKNFTCFSGHYHKHQAIGTLTYCGSPFTMSFGEANDGNKGFLVVYEDGTFHQEKLNFRKHVKIDATYEDLLFGGYGLLSSVLKEDDIVWFKLTADRSDLDKWDKNTIANLLGRHDFKFDKVATESTPVPETKIVRTDEETLDVIIDTLSEGEDTKRRLKETWRALLA